MAQVSKRKLDENKLKKIFDLFFDLIVEIKNRKQGEMLLNEILTPTEQIMVAKRVAAFYLFTKEIKPNKIAEILKVSRSTVFYYKYLFDNSQSIKGFLSKRANFDKVKRILKDVFVDLYYGGPKKGSNWSQQKKTYESHKRKLKDPL